MGVKHDWGTSGSKTGGADGLGRGGHEDRDSKEGENMRPQKEILKRFDRVAGQAEKAAGDHKGEDVSVDIC